MWTIKRIGIIVDIVLTVQIIAGPVHAQPQVTSAQKARRTPVVEVFERTKDAVVNIAATQIVERKLQFGLFDELFDPRNRTQRYEQTSLGSGAVIHPEG